MENAAKALLIAGGVLIAILLLTLFSYLGKKMSSSASRIYDMLSESEISEFNQKFLVYAGRGRHIVGTERNGPEEINIYDPLTVQDVASIMNLARDCNESNKYPTHVEVELEGKDIFKMYGDDIEWLKANEKTPISLYGYDCGYDDVIINKDTLLVERIILRKRNNPIKGNFQY